MWMVAAVDVTSNALVSSLSCSKLGANVKVSINASDFSVVFFCWSANVKRD